MVIELTLGPGPASLIASLGYMEQDGLVEASESLAAPSWGPAGERGVELFRPTEAGLAWCRRRGVDVERPCWDLLAEMAIRYSDDRRSLLRREIVDLTRQKRDVDRERGRRRRAGAE